MSFVKVFSSSTQANVFAMSVGGKVSLRYDWNYFTNSIIKEFVVRY